MCNFNQLSNDTKASMQVLMQKNADSIGGINFLLGIMESIKEKNPNALMYKACHIDSSEVIIKWNKIVFKDKLDILETLIRNKENKENLNILDEENDKKRKKILNMVKTLSPIEFKITPKNQENGTGFNFKVFDTIGDNEAKLNPVFVAIFFCSTEFMKKILKFNTNS